MPGEELIFEDFGTPVEPDTDDTAGGTEGTRGDENLIDSKPEEVKKEKPALAADAPVTDGEYESEAQRLAYEDMAKKRGWVPKENFRGDDTKFVSAREYIDNVFDINESLKKGHETQKRINDELLQSMRELREHDKKVMEAERKKHLDELNEARRQAIIDSNVEEVEAIDKQIEEAKTSADGTETEKVAPEFAEWKKNNPWFGVDKRLTALADAVAVENPTLAIDEVLKLVDAEVAEYNKFRNGTQQNTQQQRRRTTTVESGSRSQASSGKRFSQADLSTDQLKIANDFVKTGTFKTVQEYVDELASMGAIG
jgi:hypothetical protein